MASKWILPFQQQKARFLRFIKIFCIVMVCIISAYFLFRGILFAIYHPKMSEALTLFLSGGGKTDIRALAPQAIPDQEENPARYMVAAGLVSTYNKRARAGAQKKIALGDEIVTYESLTEEERISRAVDEIDRWRGFDLQDSADGYGWNDEWLPYLEKFLQEEEIKIALSLVKKGAEKGHGVFDVDWEDGLAVRLPHLAQMRHHARLLRLEALILAKKGNIKEAMENVRLIFRLRYFIDDEPTLIAKLVAVAVDSIGCSALKAVLLEITPEQQDLQAILDELKAREELNRMTHAILGETASGLYVFDSLKNHREKIESFVSDPYGTHELFLQFAWIPAMDEYNYLKKMRYLREASKKDFPDVLDYFPPEEFDRPVRPLYFNIITNIFTPALAGVLYAAGQADATIRMTRIALALSLYKSEHGSYPDSLDVLVPKYLAEMQIDPFDGKPMRYKRDGDGYMLYSVWRNRKDDGGVSTKDEKTSDWIWVMAR